MSDYKENRIIHEKLSHGNVRWIAYLENLMVVVFDFNNGPMKSPEAPHSHHHEQITYVADGELFFFIGDDNNHLEKGDIITIPSGIPHCIQTISSHVRLIDSFNPVRKDFLKQE